MKITEEELLEELKNLKNNKLQYQSVPKKVVDNAKEAINKYKSNTIDYPLFKWELVDNNYVLEIVEPSIDDLFEFLVFSKSVYKDEMLGSKKFEESVNELLIEFYSDIVMSTLKDSTFKIIQFFENKDNLEKYNRLFTKIFYSVDSLNDLLNGHIGNCKHFLKGKDKVTKKESKKESKKETEKEKLIKAINTYDDKINKKIPKILFPWFAFGLLFTKRISIKSTNILNEQYLPLSLKPSKKLAEVEEYLLEQKRFSWFIDLIHNSEKGAREQWNSSLCLFILNEITNLYDLHNITRYFRFGKIEKMFDLEFDGKRISENEKFIDIPEIDDYLEYEKYGELVKIKSLGVKTYLFDNCYSQELFEDDELWDIYNQIFKICKQSLFDTISKDNSPNKDQLPEEYLPHFSIYDEFHSKEYFIEYLDQIKEDEEQFYTNINGKKETYLYQIYGHTYKSMYAKKKEMNSEIKK